MVVEINGVEKEAKFTFNSFKYMTEFDVSELVEVERKPFKIIPIARQLLIGALNNNASDVIKLVEIESYLEKCIEDGSIMEVVEELMKELEQSSFFVSLQKGTPKKAKRK